MSSVYSFSFIVRVCFVIPKGKGGSLNRSPLIDKYRVPCMTLRLCVERRTPQREPDGIALNRDRPSRPFRRSVMPSEGRPLRRSLRRAPQELRHRRQEQLSRQRGRHRQRLSVAIGRAGLDAHRLFAGLSARAGVGLAFRLGACAGADLNNAA